MTGPSLLSIRNYSCHTLALSTFFNHPGDGRTQPVIPASDLSWALLLGGILRLVSANRLEWLAHRGHRKDLGLTRKFGDDAVENIFPLQTFVAVASQTKQKFRTHLFLSANIPSIQRSIRRKKIV